MKVHVLQTNYGTWSWAGVDADGNQRGAPSRVGGFSTREDAIRDAFACFPDLEPRDVFADGLSLGASVSAMKVPVDRASSGSRGDPADIALHHPQPQPSGIGAGTGDAPRNVSHTVRSAYEPEEMPRIAGRVVEAGARDPDEIDAPEVALP